MYLVTVACKKTIARRQGRATGRDRVTESRDTMRVLAALCLLLPIYNAKTGPHATSVTPVAGTGSGSNKKTQTTGTAGHHGPYEVRVVRGVCTCHILHI